MSETETANNQNDKAIIEKLPIRFISKVVRGFGRGSSELGIPTANLSREETISSIANYDDLPCGIYWGFARILNPNSEAKGLVYKTAVSIGFNPYYHNTTKTVEPHLIAPTDIPNRTKSSCQETILNDFYDQSIRVTLVGYLRPELPFDGLENLIKAIKNDIGNAEKMGDGEDDYILKEKDWVDSDKSCAD